MNRVVVFYEWKLPAAFRKGELSGAFALGDIKNGTDFEGYRYEGILIKIGCRLFTNINPHFEL